MFVLSPTTKPEFEPLKPETETRLSSPTEDEAIDLQEDDVETVAVAEVDDEKKKSEAARQVF